MPLLLLAQLIKEMEKNAQNEVLWLMNWVLCLPLMVLITMGQRSCTVDFMVQR